MELTIATSAAESAAAERVIAHHSAMTVDLHLLVQAVVVAAENTDAVALEEARGKLAHWCRHDLLPHALAEESVFYPATRRKAPLLIDAMISEHGALTTLIDALDNPESAVRTAATARALLAVFEIHADKENTLMLPLLAADPDQSVTELLNAMHEKLQSTDQVQAPSAHAHDCTCGESDPAGYPVLDTRIVPHAIRHATVFGALDAVAVNQGLILVASHDPLPLLAQLEQRAPGAFAISYLERGPEAWRLQLERTKA